jgi:hypothetical protein
MSDFWINNPMILFKNYYNVFPTKYMTRNEQMNAVTRLSIYFIILALMFNVNRNYIIYGFLIIVIIAIFYYLNKYKAIENEDNFNKFNNNDENLILDEKTIFDNPIFENGNENESNDVIESGYIDSDGNYVIGKEYSPFSERNTKKTKQKVKKRKPTIENPYQNIVFSDYLNDENAPQPCNVTGSDIQTEAQNLYNSSMFRNTSDVYERQNSQRLFMTMPVTTNPNDQTEFANWLFKTGPTCKENTENCTYFSDPRYDSQRY